MTSEQLGCVFKKNCTCAVICQINFHLAKILQCLGSILKDLVRVFKDHGGTLKDLEQDLLRILKVHVRLFSDLHRVFIDLGAIL